MSKSSVKKRARQRHADTKPWLWIGAGLALVDLFVVLMSRSVNPSKPNGNLLDVAANLSNTDSSFNVGTRIGQSAPAFTLLDANDQPYKFQPDDRHKYVLAFNMGST